MRNQWWWMLALGGLVISGVGLTVAKSPATEALSWNTVFSQPFVQLEITLLDGSRVNLINEMMTICVNDQFLMAELQGLQQTIIPLEKIIKVVRIKQIAEPELDFRESGPGPKPRHRGGE